MPLEFINIAHREPFCKKKLPPHFLPTVGGRKRRGDKNGRGGF
jgi:hypothetical protein